MLPESRPAKDSEIPIIDLKGMNFATAAEKQAVVDRLAHAARESGFLQVVNHGIPSDMIEKVLSAGRTFFDLPLDKKEEVSLKKSGKNFRGYLPPVHKGTDAKLKENIQEAFQIFPELTASDPQVAAGLPLHGPNPWPSAMPELKPLMLEYHAQLEQLARKLLGLLSLGLGLPENRFDEHLTKPIAMLRLLHYPPQAPDSDDGRMGTRAHTDTGIITVLSQDDVGGLEVLTKEGEWVTVTPVKDAYVINVGEVLKCWSDGIYASTPHRVINRYGRERYSFPFFLNPDYHTEFKAVIKNPSPSTAPQFHSSIDNTKGIIYGDWAVQLYSRIYHNPDAKAA